MGLLGFYVDLTKRHRGPIRGTRKYLDLKVRSNKKKGIGSGVSTYIYEAQKMGLQCLYIFQRKGGIRVVIDNNVTVN